MPDHRVSQVLEVSRVLQDPQDNLDHKDSAVKQDLPVQMVSQVESVTEENRDLLDKEDNQVRQVHKDPQASVVNREQMAPTDSGEFFLFAPTDSGEFFLFVSVALLHVHLIIIL